MFHRFALTLAPLALLLAGLSVHPGTAQAHPCAEPGQPNCGLPAAARPATAQSTVIAYFAALNQAMETGDTSAVRALYVRTASMAIHTSGGQAQVLHGSAAISTYLTTLRTASGGATWHMDAAQALAPTVVLAYAHVTASSATVTGRWADVFVIRSGRIVSLDAIAM